MEINFITIEKVMEIKSKYALKACEENGKNDRTNSILWYTSHAIIMYNKIGSTSKIEKDIKDYRNTVGELVLIIGKEAE
jgi:hypothetical protein